MVAGGRVRVETVYGRDGIYSTPYLTRVALPLGFAIHVFHRGDADPDPHDHRRGFWTFPFVSYVEHVYDVASGRSWLRVVRAWRLHYRPARYAHRILGAWDGAGAERWPFEPVDGEAGLPLPGVGTGGIATLVLWRGRKRDGWGFWVASGEPAGSGPPRRFVAWRTYVFGEAAP